MGAGKLEQRIDYRNTAGWTGRLRERSGQLERQAEKQARQQARLDGEPMTTLGATGTNDIAASAGAHAYEKTVGAFATDNGGLISAFHEGFLGMEPLI